MASVILWRHASLCVARPVRAILLDTFALWAVSREPEVFQVPGRDAQSARVRW